MVTTSSSVTVSNRSLTSGRVRSSTSSTLERSSLNTKEDSPAGGAEDDPPPGGVPPPGSMRSTPRTARSSSVAERSSSVTAPMRHRAPTSAGGSPSGTSRTYFTRARGLYSRPPEKKSPHQTTSAAPVAAPETTQAMTSLRRSARTWARACSRTSFAAAASCASVARRLERRSMSTSSASSSACDGKSRWASTKVAGGRSSTERTTAPSGRLRTTPFSGPCPHARTSPAFARSGRTTTALTCFMGTSQPWPISFQLSSPVSAKRSAASAARQWKANCAEVSFSGAKASMRTLGPPEVAQSVVTR